MEILRVEHLTKKYGKGENEVIAVNDVSFSIQKGTIIGCYSDHSPEFATESQQLLSFPSWKTLP